MDYLKCTKCGHYNEVKTEYLVLCNACGKKLENSFVSWAKHNHDKSFEDYKQEVCTPVKVEAPKSKAKSNAKPFKVRGLKYWIGFTVAFTLFYVVGHFAGDSIIKLVHKSTISKALVEVASELNKNCPMMVDNITRLDNAVALPDNVFQYNYTLLGMSKESINIDDAKQRLEPNIINFVKTNPDMKTFRDNETTINYAYKDMSGVFLFTISITPDQYKEEE